MTTAMAEQDVLNVEVIHLAALALPDDDSWLHAGERERLARLSAPSRRAQYLAGHWLARRLLADSYGADARDWQLVERRDQAPQVLAPTSSETACSTPVQLGLAHSGHWIAAAVGRHRFGIDLEQRGRTLPRSAFEPLLLNSDEPSGGLDDEALLARWVAKEAWIKRDQGSALPDRLRAIQLLPDEHGDIQLFANEQVLLALASACQRRSGATPALSPLTRWRVEEAARGD